MDEGPRGDGADGTEVDAREAARTRRRDRAANAQGRELMRPGMGKVFKQILDTHANAAKIPPKGRLKRGA